MIASAKKCEAISGLKFTGAAQELVTAGRTTGGEMQYSLSQNDGYSTAIPKGTDYTVWYKVVGDSNYNDVDPQSVNVSIGKADSQLSSSLKVLNGATETTIFTYGDTITVEFTPAVATAFSLRGAPAVNEAALFLGETQLTDPVAPDANGKFTLTYSTANKGIRANTTSTLTVKYGGSGNLNESTDTVNVTLNPKPVRVVGVRAMNRPYAPNDTSVEINLSRASVYGRVGEDDVTLTGGAGRVATADVDSLKLVTISLELAGADRDYYTLSEQPDGIYVEILQKTVNRPTIVITPNSYSFTGSAITPDSVVVKDGNDIIPVSEYTLSYDNNTNVGDKAKVIVTENPPGNYYVYGTATFSITKGDSQLGGLTVLNGTTETNAFTYGDTVIVEFTPAVATTFSLRSAPAANEAALFLGNKQLTDPASPDTSGKFTLTYNTANKGLPVGTSTLTVQYGGNNNLNKNVGTIDVTLNAKGVTLSGVTAVSRAYGPGNTSVELSFASASVVGREGDDDVAPTGGAGVLADAGIGNGKAVTVKGISLTGAAKGYYLLTAQPAGLIVDITPKEVTNPTILLKPNLYYFTGQPIIPKSVVVKDGDNVIPQSEYTLSYANNIDVGEKAQVIVTDNPDGNYVVGGSTVFTIVKAADPPKTGDSSMPLLWLGLCLLSGAGLPALALGKRRRV